MSTTPKNYTLQGEEKQRYLSQVDQSLFRLAKNLGMMQDKTKQSTLQQFGQEHLWDWSRLDPENTTAQTFAGLVERIRQEYSWFNDILTSKNHSENRGYFNQTNINASSGLPGQFDFIELHRLKKEAEKILTTHPSYQQLFDQWNNLLMQDHTEIEAVATQSATLQSQALQRSFLEQLEPATLLSWEQQAYSLPPVAQQKIFLGGEELWNLSFIRYSLASGMFQLYSIDLWQDNIHQAQITKSNQHQLQNRNQTPQGQISPALEKAFKFAENNAAWYILQSIDQQFESLHPVHVSRLLIGPFESKYRKDYTEIPKLNIAEEIICQDPNCGILRSSWQYAYAPNHKTEAEKIEQIIYREDWRQEIIVCPSQYAGRISNAIAGTDVEIWQY